MAQRMTFGLFSGAASQRIEFVRMKGPRGTKILLLFLFILLCVCARARNNNQFSYYFNCFFSSRFVSFFFLLFLFIIEISAIFVLT